MPTCMYYAHIEIVIAFLGSKLFSFLVITSYGGRVSGSKFGRYFLLGLLYLPIPTRAGFESTRPWFLSPEVFEKINVEVF